MVHLEPIVYTGRVFLKGSYGDRYDAVFTLQQMGKIGFVSACRGKINRQALLDLTEQARGFGMNELKWLTARDFD